MCERAVEVCLVWVVRASEGVEGMREGGVSVYEKGRSLLDGRRAGVRGV